MPTIPDLPSVTTPGATDVLPIDDGATTSKITAADLRGYALRPEVVEETGTTRVLSAADDGRVIVCTNASGCSVDLPDGLPQGFSCLLVRGGSAGTVTADISGTGSLLLPSSVADPPEVSEQGAVMGIMRIVGSNVFLAYGSLA